MQNGKTETSTSEIDKTNKEGKKLKRQHNNQRSYDLHNPRLQQNTKLAAMIYMQKAIGSPWQIHVGPEHALPILVSSYEFNHVDIEHLVFLISSIPSGSCLLFYITAWVLREGFDRDISVLGRSVLRLLTLCTFSVCESLYFFPYIAGRSFFDYDRARHQTRSSRTQLGVILFLCYFVFWKEILWLYARLLSYLLLGSWSLKQCYVWLLSQGGSLQSNQIFAWLFPQAFSHLWTSTS